jgi:uridine kinase
MGIIATLLVSTEYMTILVLCLFQLEMQTWAAVSRLNQPIEFQDHNVDDMQDGYVNFDPRKHKYVTVMRRRTDVAVQVTPSGRVINSNLGK